MADVGDFQRLMAGDRIGRSVELGVVREGRRRPLAIVPVELTKEPARTPSRW